MVFELIQILERARETELLREPPRDRQADRLAPARVRAAGIRPETRPEHLAQSALLEQELVVAIEDEDRERAMQDTLAHMAIGLGLEADLAILIVDEDQLLACVRDDLVTRHSNPLRVAPAWPGSRRRESRSRRFRCPRRRWR